MEAFISALRDSLVLRVARALALQNHMEVGSDPKNKRIMVFENQAELEAARPHVKDMDLSTLAQVGFAQPDVEFHLSRNATKSILFQAESISLAYENIIKHQKEMISSIRKEAQEQLKKANDIQTEIAQSSSQQINDLATKAALMESQIDELRHDLQIARRKPGKEQREMMLQMKGQIASLKKKNDVLDSDNEALRGLVNK